MAHLTFIFQLSLMVGKATYGSGIIGIPHVEHVNIVKDLNCTLRCSHTVQPYHSRHFRTTIVQSRIAVWPSISRLTKLCSNTKKDLCYSDPPRDHQSAARSATYLAITCTTATPPVRSAIEDISPTYPLKAKSLGSLQMVHGLKRHTPRCRWANR